MNFTGTFPMKTSKTNHYLLPATLRLWSRIAFAAIVAGGMMFGSSQAALAAESDRIAHFAAKHAAAEQALYRHFKNGIPAKNYARSVFELSKQETFMLATRWIRIDDPRLVGHLAADASFKNMSTYDYPRFVLRLIQYRIKQKTGIDVSTANPFAGRNFEVRARNQ